MSLTPEDRVRYSRQILLPEIGQSGQERLCNASFAFSSDLDEEAAKIAAVYLQRAGLALDPASPRKVSAPARNALDVMAREPGTEHAVAAVTGALAAVETIKSVLGLD